MWIAYLCVHCEQKTSSISYLSKCVNNILLGASTFAGFFGLIHSRKVVFVVFTLANEQAGQKSINFLDNLRSLVFILYTHLQRETVA